MSDKDEQTLKNFKPIDIATGSSLAIIDMQFPEAKRVQSSELTSDTRKRMRVVLRQLQDGKLHLSPKYGYNLSLVHCFICGNRFNLFPWGRITDSGVEGNDEKQGMEKGDHPAPIAITSITTKCPHCLKLEDRIILAGGNPCCIIETGWEEYDDKGEQKKRFIRKNSIWMNREKLLAVLISKQWNKADTDTLNQYGIMVASSSQLDFLDISRESRMQGTEVQIDEAIRLVKERVQALKDIQREHELKHEVAVLGEKEKESKQ